MKEKKNTGKVIVVIVVIVLVLISGLFLLVMCSGDEKDSSGTSGKTEAGYQNGADGGGSSAQKENIINGGKPYGDPDTTWTVMLYLCGTDLESQYGFASVNLDEICNADISDNANVVIETGGAGSWQTNGIPSDELARFHMENGEMHIDETIVNAEVPFEVVGFDACLMSTLETAEVFQGYAHYMVASEETEPGTGWDYIAWLNYLSNNTGCSGKELGQTIVDSYMDKCARLSDRRAWRHFLSVILQSFPIFPQLSGIIPVNLL